MAALPAGTQEGQQSNGGAEGCPEGTGIQIGRIGIFAEGKARCSEGEGEGEGEESRNTPSAASPFPQKRLWRGLVGLRLWWA